jgi:hypothetical protein
MSLASIPIIPTHGGLVAIADHLRRDPEVDRIGPHLLKLLKLILTKTNFTTSK